jgi:gliding motility-associated-like protein/uncharacterized repeat protein (TIGR01451 family)
MTLFFLQIYKSKCLHAVLAQLLFTSLASAVEVDFSFTADKSEVRQGDELSYRVSVHNRNAAAANNILIVDSIPRGVTLVSCSATDYTLTSRNLLVRISHLPVDEEVSFDVTVRVERTVSIVKTLQLRENGATLKTLHHKISVLSNNVLTNNEANMFTPNGDGVNDYFEISGLLNYPNNELLVFNRYSDKVYHKRGYANNWDGSKLPEGCYYYLLTIYLDNSVVQKYNGSIIIKR